MLVSLNLSYVFIGGDGTYLRTAGMIENTDVPILGLNTDPSRSIGFLCNNKIYNDMKEKQIERIFDNLEKENFEYFYRQRLNFSMESPTTGERVNKLVLNEIFVAEKDTGKTSIYKLFVDGQDLGKFKSSGIIISTGTGSSGWLFSARRITQSDVRTILNYLGSGESIELVSLRKSYLYFVNRSKSILLRQSQSRQSSHLMKSACIFSCVRAT